ncbi:MAG TPA: DUF2231 domain-containing protein [Pyrinomonadaceae bacterium]|nr:DUF2231 domain-containing protein [Pyrinomonadaceae bacterium]
MESKFKVLGHGAHPILIVFPLGLLGGSVIFDIIYLVTGTTTFSFVAYWLIITGIIGGVVAAVPGFVDWFAIPKNTRAKRVGLIHGIGNDVVLAIFALSWWLRYDDRPYHVPSTSALALSFAGFALAMFTGWLGGELVERLGVAVHEGAHLDAPNTLSGRPASERD